MSEPHPTIEDDPKGRSPTKAPSSSSTKQSRPRRLRAAQPAPGCKAANQGRRFRNQRQGRVRRLPPPDRGCLPRWLRRRPRHQGDRLRRRWHGCGGDHLLCDLVLNQNQSRTRRSSRRLHRRPCRSQGLGNRGGSFYQVLAVFLTYTAIALMDVVLVARTSPGSRSATGCPATNVGQSRERLSHPLLVARPLRHRSADLGSNLLLRPGGCAYELASDTRLQRPVSVLIPQCPRLKPPRSCTMANDQAPSLSRPAISCPACGSDVAPSLLSCPSCRRLVHAARLKELAQAAEDHEAAGDFAVHWPRGGAGDGITASRHPPVHNHRRPHHPPGPPGRSSAPPLARRRPHQPTP